MDGDRNGYVAERPSMVKPLADRINDRRRFAGWQDKNGNQLREAIPARDLNYSGPSDPPRSNVTARGSAWSDSGAREPRYARPGQNDWESGSDVSMSGANKSETGYPGYGEPEESIWDKLHRATKNVAKERAQGQKAKCFPYEF